MLEMSLFQMIGLVGFLSYIATFIWLQNGRLRGDSIQYSALSIFSASMVLVSLTENFNISSVLIQISWITIGFYGVLRHLRKSNPVRRFFRGGSRVASVAALFLGGFLALSSATSNGNLTANTAGESAKTSAEKSHRLCVTDQEYRQPDCAAAHVLSSSIR